VKTRETVDWETPANRATDQEETCGRRFPFDVEPAGHMDAPFDDLVFTFAGVVLHSYAKNVSSPEAAAAPNATPGLLTRSPPGTRLHRYPGARHASPSLPELK